MTITFRRFATLLCITAVLFAYAASASADHSEDEENHSHATTIQITNISTMPDTLTITPVSSNVIDVNRLQRMEALLKALKELVALLQYQKEHIEDEHYEEDDDEHNDEDHA